MAKMNKISSFQTFSEVREAENADKLQQENQAKRLELTERIGKILDEMEITSFEDLDEEVRDQLVEKTFGLVKEGDKTKVSKKEIKMHLDMFQAGDIDGNDLSQAISAIIFGEVKGPGMESKDSEQVSEATVVMDAINPDDKDFLKFLKKNKVKVIDTVKSGPSGHPEITMQGKRKDLEAVLADGELGWDDPGLAEFIEESINISEAVIVTGRRDAKKVLTAYTKFFQKYPALADRRFAGLHLGAIKSLMVSALTDANFHRESAACGKSIKGAKLQPVFIKPMELNKTEIKIPVGKVASILDDNASLISGAAGFSGLGIAEGTALYLDSLKYVKEAEAVIACFNSTFESEVTDVTEGNAFLGARAKAIEEDAEEFEFNGKKYPVIKESEEVTESAEPKCNNKKGHLYKQIDKDGTVECVHCGLRNSLSESEVNEAKSFKNTEDFEAFLKEIDAMPERAVRKIMGKEYIDTPGFYEDEKDDYDDVIDFMISNMGADIYHQLEQWWENNVQESAVTEAKFVKDFDKDVLDAETKADITTYYPSAKFFIGKSTHFFGELDKNLFFKAYYKDYVKKAGGKIDGDFKIVMIYSEKGRNFVPLFTREVTESVVTEAKINSDEEFKEYATTVLQKAFGEDYDEAKANEVIDGILAKVDGDYGAAVGMLTSSLGESVVTEKTYNKKSLMKAMKADDGMIQLGNGQEYVIYAYGNGNDDNDNMWGDKSIFALDQDGEEHEIEYSDIVSYNEANADGTISDDEDEKREELLNRVKEQMEELLASAEFDAKEIGGSFRSPGIMFDIRKQLDKQVKKFK
jgi:Zn ribbon nucleic-acid-binding protein